MNVFRDINKSNLKIIKLKGVHKKTLAKTISIAYLNPDMFDV